MRHKKAILFGIAVFLIVAGVAGTLLWALLREPEFYARASSTIPDEPEARKRAAKSLVQETTNLINNIKHADQWSATFKQSEINSWFVEELFQERYDDVVPEGVSHPRLSIEEGSVQLGFRFQKSGWNGIVSLHLKPWIEKENQLAIEIEAIRAGIVPVPLEDMLDEMTSQLIDAGWDVTWNHANGHDVAVINLSKQNAEAPVLESLAVLEGEVRVRGHRKDSPLPDSDVNKSHRTAMNR